MPIDPRARRSCGSEEVHHWTDAGFTCYSPAHLSLCIVSTLLAAVFFGLSALFSVTMIDPHPLSPALAAKSSGAWGRAAWERAAMIMTTDMRREGEDLTDEHAAHPTRAPHPTRTPQATWTCSCWCSRRCWW